MIRAATAPQLQAPQPDISAGPRPGFSPCSSPESQEPDSYLQAALARLRTFPPTPRPGADFTRLAARLARSQWLCRVPNTVDT